MLTYNNKTDFMTLTANYLTLELVANGLEGLVFIETGQTLHDVL